MADETVTVALEGPDISLASFVAATSALDALLKALTSEVAKGAKLSWDIDSLEAGSAIATVVGRLISGDPDAPAQVRVAYEKVGEALMQRTPVPYSHAVRRQAQLLQSVLDDHVAAIRLETESRDTLTKDQQFQVSQQAPLVSLGAVEGRIQALSSRRGLRFTLYDIIEDRAVGCYLQPGEEGMMRELWGRRAIVEGEVRRDPQSGRPTKIRRVTAVEPVPEDPAPRSWREARGALARVWDGTPAEDAIRKIRDAW